MPVARREPPDIRVIAHVDLDCFYVQVEQRKNPELRGKPAAVVQYNAWKGGGLIAVGYEARQCGVKRNMRGDEARGVCPDIHLVQVPVAHGKADLTVYRDAGSEVVAVLSRKGRCERASIDEVYLDLTEAASMLFASIESISEEALKSHVVGISEDGDDGRNRVREWFYRKDGDPRDGMLACGAIVVADLRMAVLAETQFTCSAGIAHNKMLAKLASGMHKPAQQTIVPSSSVSGLLESLPIKKMKQLGGKLGDSLQVQLGIKNVGDLLQFSEPKLQELYGINTGTWLWSIARGINGDEVQGRTLPKSHSCGKTFPGPQALQNLSSVGYWVEELAAELQERLDADSQQNKRTAHLLTLHARGNHGCKVIQEGKFPSKSCVLRYGKDRIAHDAMQLFERALRDFSLAYGQASGRVVTTGNCKWAITSMFISASNIIATPSGVAPITSFFASPSSSVFGSSHETKSLKASLSAIPSRTGVENERSEVLCTKESVEQKNDTLYSIPSGKGIHLPEEDGDEISINTSTFSIVAGSLRENSEKLLRETNSCEPMVEKLAVKDSQQHIDDFFNDQIDKNRENSDILSRDLNSCEPTMEKSMVKDSQQRIDVLFNDPIDQNGENSDKLLRDTNSCEPTMEKSMVKDSQQCIDVLLNDLIDQNEENNDKLLRDTNSCELTMKKSVAKDTQQLMDVHLHDPIDRNGEKRRENSFSSSSRGLKASHTTIASIQGLWQRKQAIQSSEAKMVNSSEPSWRYKAEDIDEDVLSELPEEIQRELNSVLGLKRPRSSYKRTTIGDFFKSPPFNSDFGT